MEKTKIHVLYQKLWNFDLLLKKTIILLQKKTMKIVNYIAIVNFSKL